MRRIVYFHSESELRWHQGRSLEEVISDDHSNVYCHIEVLRQLKTQRGWVVDAYRVDEVYARGGYRAAEEFIIDRSLGADFLLFMVSARPQFLSDRTFAAIKARVPDAQIILDSHDERKYHSSMTRCLAGGADLILVSDYPLGAEALRRDFGNATFFHYQSRLAFPPGDSATQRYDVSFIGSDKCKRAAYVAAISSAFPHLQCKFVLPKRPYTESPERVDLNELREITYQSRINLVCNEKKPGLLHISWRFWQVLMCKALPLVEYTPDLEYLFDVERDLFVYRDEKELIERIQFILDPANQDGVKRKRERAYARVSDVVLEDLVEMIDRRLSAKEILASLPHPQALVQAEIPAVSPSNARYKSTRYRYLFQFLRRGELRKALLELPVLKYGLPGVRAFRSH